MEYIKLNRFAFNVYTLLLHFLANQNLIETTWAVIFDVQHFNFLIDFSPTSSSYEMRTIVLFGYSAYTVQNLN